MPATADTTAPDDILALDMPVLRDMIAEEYEGDDDPISIEHYGGKTARGIVGVIYTFLWEKGAFTSQEPRLWPRALPVDGRDDLVEIVVGTAPTDNADLDYYTSPKVTGEPSILARARDLTGDLKGTGPEDFERICNRVVIAARDLYTASRAA